MYACVCVGIGCRYRYIFNIKITSGIRKVKMMMGFLFDAIPTTFNTWLLWRLLPA